MVKVYFKHYIKGNLVPYLRYFMQLGPGTCTKTLIKFNNTGHIIQTRLTLANSLNDVEYEQEVSFNHISNLSID